MATPNPMGKNPTSLRAFLGFPGRQRRRFKILARVSSHHARQLTVGYIGKMAVMNMSRTLAVIGVAISLGAQSLTTVHQSRVRDFAERSAKLDTRFESHVFQSRNGRTMPYRLFRPSEGSDKLPLVVYLHGSGGLGDDNIRQIEGGNIFGTHVWALDDNQSRLPAFVIAPQTHVSQGWGQEGMEIAIELTQALIRDLPIDPARIYLTGQSMGGMGTWNMLAAHPQFFAAAVIVCGGGDPGQASLIRGTPIWIFHGTRDKAIRVESARLIAQALTKEGNKPKYTR